MGAQKLESKDKVKVSILKGYLILYPYWKQGIQSKDTKDSLKLLNVLFVDYILCSIANVKEKDILQRGMLKKELSNHDIAKTLFYSESSLRNNMNKACKRIVNEVETCYIGEL